MYNKIVFRAHFRQKWIDLHRSKTKMINGQQFYYSHRRIHLISGNALFFW